MRTAILTIFLLLISVSSFAESKTIEQLLTDRVYGDVNAPITLVEHSSLTCPHCKSLHDQILPKIKEKYIDTGKVKLISSDYPLNAPALHASMVARCFDDNETYFSYIEFLFSTQDKWARAQNPIPYLAQNARLLGISSDELDACMKTEGYQDAFIKKIQTTKEIKNIESTPTLIIAETDERIEGVKPFIIYDTAIERALESVDNASTNNGNEEQEKEE